MRIAFVTPEFVTEYRTGGGLGNYLNRITSLCRDRGHQVDVFVISDKRPETIDYEGIRVHRVASALNAMRIRVRYRLCRWLGLEVARYYTDFWADSLGLAQAVERVEAKQPYDLIQSADYRGVGLCISRRSQRPHVIRCSSATDLCIKAEGNAMPQARANERIWGQSIVRADMVYAPSQFVASHVANRFGVRADVIRPPAWIETLSANCPVDLPRRFSIHFGQLMDRKGTDAIARALPYVWEQAPDFHMLWIGRIEEDDRKRWVRMLGDSAGRLEIVDPIEKPQLYAILDRAEFGVLPTLVDNLPNTVIECLLKGVPVIGFHGASVDELVVPGRMGDLVPMGDIAALARAMVQGWRGESQLRRGFEWKTDVALQMSPSAAVDALISLAKI